MKSDATTIKKTSHDDASEGGESPSALSRQSLLPEDFPTAADGRPVGGNIPPASAEPPESLGSVIEENLKPLIMAQETLCVSFDLFDTLVYRPLYQPTDLFSFLDFKYADLAQGNTPFRKMRVEAEERARRENALCHVEEVTLDDIYQSLGKGWDIPAPILQAMALEERRLEIQFCTRRETAGRLFDMAKSAGKRVIVTSDMYLDEDTITTILEKNGYAHHDGLYLSSSIGKTKASGTLFRHVVETLGVAPHHVLHIGDNAESDVAIPGALGVRTFHFPRAIDVMLGRVQSHSRHGCLQPDAKACPPTMRKALSSRSLCYRTALALAANRYFDNPFRDFLPDTDFNADPFFIGYYPVAMHLLGLSLWISHIATLRGYNKVHYNARDGYLPFLYHQTLAARGVVRQEADYVYCSRTMLLPGLLSGPEDIVSHITYGDRTPAFFLERFHFCIKPMESGDLTRLLREHGFSLDEPLRTEAEVQAFQTLFQMSLFDSRRMAESRSVLQQYYNRLVADDAAFFDVGYAGSAPSALSEITGKKVNVLYIHDDGVDDARRRHNFTLDCYYPFTPAVSGALREHLLSEIAPHCIGLVRQDKEPVPVFADETRSASEISLTGEIHRGAMQFLDDFLSHFGDYLHVLPKNHFEMSLPLEGFLHFPRMSDIAIFKSIEFDNFFHLGDNRINLYSYSLECAVRFSPFLLACGRIAEDGRPVEVCTAGTLGEFIQKKGPIAKFFLYLLLDRKILATILKMRAERSSFLKGTCFRAVARLVALLDTLAPQS